MRSFSRRSLLGFLILAPMVAPAIAAATQDAPLVTAGADVQAGGVILVTVVPRRAAFVRTALRHGEEIAAMLDAPRPSSVPRYRRISRS